MLKFPSYFTGFGSKTDGSARLSFATQELSDQDFAELKKNLNGFGFLLFSENEISTKDIPVERAEEDKNKTPSKRLRAVLYVMSQQKGIPKEKFEEFYREQVEKIIEHIKTKLDQ